MRLTHVIAAGMNFRWLVDVLMYVMRRRAAVLWFLSAWLTPAACSSTGGQAPTSTSNSTSFQPSTSPASPVSSSTTTLLSHSAAVHLVRVDPATLRPVPEAETVTSGDWIRGTGSKNGKWLVLNVWIDTEPETDLIQVIEVSSGRVATNFDGPLLHELRVGDDGSVFHDTGRPGGWLRRLEPGQSRFETVFEFPDAFSRWGFMNLLGGDKAGWIGTLEAGPAQAEAALLVADLSDGSAQTIRLPGVALGMVGEQQLDDWAAPEIMEPAVVWETDRHRALVVHADQPKVTIVDLDDGGISEHTWARPTSWVDALFAWLTPPALAKGPSLGTTRHAVLSPSGDRLHIATRQADVVVDSEGSWSVHSVPQGVEVVDTDDWTVAAEFDIPASQVALSPDGDYLVAAGAEMIETALSTGYELKDVHVIRTDRLEVVGSVDVPGEWIPDIQFSADSTHMYVGRDGGGTINIVELETAQTLDVVATSERLTMFGTAGMLSTPHAPQTATLEHRQEAALLSADSERCQICAFSYGIIDMR